MSTFVLFALLGLGSGGLLALMGTGMVLIYRGSGVINFAHGGFALVGAFTVYELDIRHGQGLVTSVVAAVLLSAALGAMVQLLVMRPLRTASPLARVIATLGVLSVLTQLVLLRYGPGMLLSAQPLPSGPVRISGDVSVNRQTFYLLGVAVVVTILMGAASSYSRIGRAVSASAENARAAAALGWSPDLLAGVTWGLGGALAGLVGALLPAISSGFISTNTVGMLIIGALATALVGEFRSYPLTLVAGLLIGVMQSLATQYAKQTGVPDSVPFLFIIVVLVLRGRGLPLRGTLNDRLPRVGTGTMRPLLVVVSILLALLATATAGEGWMPAVIGSAGFAIVGLSLVVLTGYAGQLSIAQFALAGIGAYAAGRLLVTRGVPFELASLAGVLTAMVVGLLFGLPALRTRGVNLAVVTLGLGFAVHQILFSNTALTGGAKQTQPTGLHVLGLDVDPVSHPRNYALVSVGLLSMLVLGVANLRRGRVGRRLLAVRTNERAAAAIGVDVTRTKLYAFTLSAGIAAVGGIVLGFSYSTIPYLSLFEPNASINAVLLTVIGGVGYIAGPLIGSVLTPGGLLAQALDGADGTGWARYLPLLTGLGLLVTLIQSQNGLAERVGSLVDQLGRRMPLPRSGARAVLVAARDAAGDEVSAAPLGRVEPKALVVSGLTQRFGGMTALAEVDLRVAPGEVVGLLGPNGAGKTTLIDGVTGYNRVSGGTVTLGGHDVTRWSPSRRARAGLSRSFQSLELFDDITVRENLLAAADPRDSLAYVTDLVRPGSGRLPRSVVTTVAELGLGGVLDRRPEDLSYGQRRLVAIARAVVSRPSILLLDEPAAGLDDTESAELGRLVRRLADEWGIGILLIEHDVAMVLETSDRVVVLDFGRKIAEGTPSEIRSSRAVRAAYLGAAVIEAPLS